MGPYSLITIHNLYNKQIESLSYWRYNKACNSYTITSLLDTRYLVKQIAPPRHTLVPPLPQSRLLVHQLAHPKRSSFNFFFPSYMFQFTMLFNLFTNGQATHVMLNFGSRAAN